MNASTVTAADSAQRTAHDGRPSAWRLLLNNYMATTGLIMLALIVLLAVLAPLLPLQDPNATSLADRVLPMGSAGHMLGTDELGRDLLSRLIWGTRVSLAVGLAATAFAAIIGSLIGLVAGFCGGWLDNALMRGVDTLMAFPDILLALAIVAVLGPGLMNALYAVAIVNVPFFARTVRGAAVGVVAHEFVDAARLTGLSAGRILFTEVLPNVLPVIIITISSTIGWMILETAGLSFLGLGAQPPQADLGSMLANGRKLIITAPHVATIPGLVILVLVISVNLLGDGLRDVFDPRLKSGALARPGPLTATADDALAQVPAVVPEDENAAAPLLQVRGLTLDFTVGKRVYHAVRDVSFDLYPGQCLGVVGESGSGKSVTAMALTGLVPTPPGRIVRGSVQFDGQQLVGAPLATMQALRGNRISYIFQDPLSTLNPLLRVGEQLTEAMRKHKRCSRDAARAQALRLLDEVRIPNAASRLHAYPHELSGGLRQRVGIALALMNDPDIVIADEPTTALDVTIQAEILALLARLRQERQMSLIFITHDFGVVSQLSDQIMVMYAGEVVEYGASADVLQHPAHPYTQRLLACVPKLGQAQRVITPIPGLPPDVSHLPQGCAFADRCHLATAACRRAPIALHTVKAGHVARCIHMPEALHHD